MMILLDQSVTPFPAERLEGEQQDGLCQAADA
jgi:hypothetical protein